MKAKILRVSPEVIFSILSQECLPAFRITQDRLPEDAKLVNVRNAWPNAIELLIESETFPEVKDGEEFPFINPTFETVDRGN